MAFLGVRISHDIGRLLSGIEVPDEKVSPSEYHITILCFEENWPIDELAKAMEATYDIVSEIKPFLVKVDKVDCFPAHEDNPIPIIAKIKSDDLHDLSDKLRKKFDDDKIEFSKLHKEYKPHITLAYAKDKIEAFDIDPVEFSISELVLWGGDHGDDRIFITFPLKGPEKHKHSFLLQKIDLFYKIACNPPQAYLTPSYERRKIERWGQGALSINPEIQKAINYFLQKGGFNYKILEDGKWTPQMTQAIKDINQKLFHNMYSFRNPQEMQALLKLRDTRMKEDELKQKYHVK